VIQRMIFMLAIMMTSVMPMHAGMWNKVQRIFNGGSQKDPTIKVLVVDKSNGSMLEVRGAYNIYNPQDGSRLSTCLLSKSYFVQPIKTGIKWGEQFPGTYQIEIVPDDANTTILVNGVQYRGSVQVFQVGDTLSIINEVDIEDYTKSILGPLVDKPLHDEVLAAMAIASRTEAYYHISRAGSKAFWHVDAEKVGYEGYSVTFRDNGVDKAVDRTKYFVMNRNEAMLTDKYFAARWTEHSAGKTAPVHMMFRQEMSAPRDGINVPLAAVDRDSVHWNYSTTKAEFAGKANIGTLTGVEIYTDPFSRKVYNIRIKNEQGFKDVDFFTLQNMLGKDNIQSSDFNIDISGNIVMFSGYGQGHGVGMCIYSSEVMAEEGRDAAKILAGFFPDAYIVKSNG